MASNAQVQQYTQTFTSFSGADIKCVIGDQLLKEVQGISYSVTREKAPIYTLGSSDPRSFSRGKRGIAGSLIFTVFDRNPLAELARNAKYFYYAKADEIWNPDDYLNQISPVNELVDTNGMPLGIEKRPAVYEDQILPFDITITFQNEYGQMAVQRIYGVEILNAGSGLSVDDIVNEMQATFVARTLSPITPVAITGNDVSTNYFDRVTGGPNRLGAGVDRQGLATTADLETATT